MPEGRSALPLRRLGRLELGPGLRAFQPGAAASGLAVTAGDPAASTDVPLADGLAWAALHQDAIVVQLPDRARPLAGRPPAALLRRGPAA